MTVVLIFLVGVLMGAINFGTFCLGYYVRSKKKDENAVQDDKNNQKAVAEMMEWLNYGGVRNGKN